MFIYIQSLEDEVRKLYKKYVKLEKVDVDFKSNPAITSLIQNNIQSAESNAADDDDSVDYSLNNFNIGNAANGNITNVKSGNGAGLSSAVVGNNKGKIVTLDKGSVDKALLDAATETEKQKQFLENELDFLKKKLIQNEQNSNSLQRKKVKENSQLLFELTDLRQQVRKINKNS